jgi:hypothetical protein
MDRLLPTIQATMAFTDLFEVPLIIAIVYSVKLSRRWGRAWKGVGIAFACYSAWVALTAVLVPFSPSCYVVMTLGTLLDPVDPMWKSTSMVRVWACGIAGTVLLFWATPTSVAWLLRRRGGRAIAVTPQPGSWITPAVAGLLLLAAQQVVFAHSGRLSRDAKARGIPPAEDGSSMPWGLAAALTLPVVWLLAMAAVRWLRQRRSERPSGSA